MTSYSNKGPKSEKDRKKDDSVSEQSLTKNETPVSSYDSRKKNLSKREIMEELSRARFPWDE
jgi:hypothetical protein